jgi:transcriptional regulator with XRE-family HTH domain
LGLSYFRLTVAGGRISTPAMPKSIHRESYKLLCSLLVARRKEAGLSQYDLARKLKRPQSFVAKIEVGERRIDVLEFLDITRALNADPHEILRAVEAAYFSSQENNP